MRSKTQAPAPQPLRRQLKTRLENWRRELGHHVHDRIRDVRGDVTSERDVLDAAETSECGIQDDIEFAVIQIQAETLNQINAALLRIDEGCYGRCVECGGEIAEVRLRALPFAVRCRPCEDARESANERDRPNANRMGSFAGFQDLSD